MYWSIIYKKGLKIKTIIKFQKINDTKDLTPVSFDQNWFDKVAYLLSIHQRRRHRPPHN